MFGALGIVLRITLAGVTAAATTATTTQTFRSCPMRVFYPGAPAIKRTGTRIE